MISPKGKRKLIYAGKVFYWFVRIDASGHRIHILSNEEKLHLRYPFIDTEISVTPGYIRKLLEKHYGKTADKTSACSGTKNGGGSTCASAERQSAGWLPTSRT